MRRIVFYQSVGFAGGDANEFIVYPDDVSDDVLNAEAEYLALNHAESYGIYPMSDMPEDYDEYDTDVDEYSDNIEGWWEDFDPEKHEGLACGETVTQLFERLEKQF